MDITAYFHGNYVLGEPVVDTKDGLRYQTGGRLVGAEEGEKEILAKIGLSRGA